MSRQQARNVGSGKFKLDTAIASEFLDLGATSSASEFHNSAVAQSSNTQQPPGRKNNNYKNRPPKKVQRDSDDEHPVGPSAATFVPPIKVSLLQQFEESRIQAASSVVDYPFNELRVRALTTNKQLIKSNNGGILYWMSRSQRVQDNWGLLYAQKLALKHNLPLHVCFSLVPSHLNATYRHYYFMLEGLKEVEKQLKDLNIPFHMLIGFAKDQVPQFVRDHKMNAVVSDFSPLRVARKWTDELKANLPNEIPLFQVDSHNVAPCWYVATEMAPMPPVIRAKLFARLDEFLTDFPPVIRHEANSALTDPALNPSTRPSFDWDACFASLKCDMSVQKCDMYLPGYTQGINMFESFLRVRLRNYEALRNEPNKNMQSNMSPWFHFGQVSIQRCVHEIQKYKDVYAKSVKSFVNEALVWRELGENLCYYNPNYDSFDGAPGWAKKSLTEHSRDKRPYCYTLEEMEKSKTHDKLWNAAQIQMMTEGKMHGFFRMYWGKKILEWSETPQKAVEYAVYLNDKYSLDGRDPSGYAGIMWAICGIHDTEFPERPIYGKVRYMSYDGCKKKFNIDEFASRYLQY